MLENIFLKERNKKILFVYDPNFHSWNSILNESKNPCTMDHHQSSSVLNFIMKKLFGQVTKFDVHDILIMGIWCMQKNKYIENKWIKKKNLSDYRH